MKRTHKKLISILLSIVLLLTAVPAFAELGEESDGQSFNEQGQQEQTQGGEQPGEPSTPQSTENQGEQDDPPDEPGEGEGIGLNGELIDNMYEALELTAGWIWYHNLCFVLIVLTV